MKFLGNLFTIGLGILLVTAVGWMVVPEVVSWIGALRVRSDVATVVKLSRKPAHDQECSLGRTYGGERPLVAYQLRFENDMDYVVEAVCTSSLDKKIVIREGKLPLGVVKMPGYSGVRIDVSVEPPANWVVVGRWGRYWAIGYEDNKITMLRVWDTKTVKAGETASNSCQGWGYQCCSATNQVGRGESVDQGVVDCPGSCYGVCQSRPSITAFSTDPAPNEGRVVYLPVGGAKVTFSWKVQDVDGLVDRVSIDFGDGEEEEFSGNNDSVVHQYKCMGGCVYMVTLKVYDNDGLESNARALLSSLKVVVQ